MIMNDQRRDTDCATAWHSLDVAEVFERLSSDGKGLLGEEAAGRLLRCGPNQLPSPERERALKRFLRQFNNVLIYILLLAGLGTVLLEHWVDSGVIFGVVLINAIIGFIQEGKAEEALDAIRSMLSPKALVIRDGHKQTIPAGELVPGDLVLLQAGDRVPADLRLVEARNMRIDEAVLTGESMAVDKAVAPVKAEAELGDRSSLAFSGTLVAYGMGRGVVVATGEDTQIGRVSLLLSRVETLTTPLLRQMAQFGRWLSVAIIVVAAATFAFGYWVQDYSAVEMFLAAVSLTVAAIPEGLPAIMTITLAIGVQRMAGRNAIIRRLPAVETLGSVTVICSDKTGTLTRNEMTAQSVVTVDDRYEITGVGYEPRGGFERDDEDVDPEAEPVLWPLLRGAMLCNDAAIRERDGAWRMEGDPTEGALICAAMKAGLDARLLGEEMPRTDIIPFESAYKFMVTLHHDHAGHGLIIMKGAPEGVLDVCSRQRGRDGDRPLDKRYWNEAMETIAARGQRLLAVAIKETGADHRTLGFDDVKADMVLLGVMGIIDPPREEAIRAVRQCQQAGIRVKMITGDHGVTARTIAAELGIGSEQVVTGNVLENIGDDELSNRVRTIDVFARATPEHKLRLVQALQANHQVVAMTGDGVNDAPALKRADIGVAMGVKGTEAAKEAAEMVLTDDNFASIAHAVEEGRTVYDNLKKAILFILPTNGAQAMTIVIAIALGLALPLTPVQVLWVNMVTAVTLALALAFEPAEPGLMRRPPRPPDTPILSALLMWRVIFVSVLLVAGTFGHYVWMIEAAAATEELARTVAINTLVVGEIFYLFNSRYILEPVLSREGLLGSRTVLIAIGVLVILQVLFTYAGPLQFLFATEAMDAWAWLRIVLFGIVLMLIVEVEKAVLRRRMPHAPAAAG